MSKLITASQAEDIRKMGNEKKIGRERWDRASRDGRWSTFLDSLKEPVPPLGCRMHILKVRVKLDEPWQDAVNAAGPSTPNDYDVHKVGDLFMPTGIGEEE